MDCYAQIPVAERCSPLFPVVPRFPFSLTFGLKRKNAPRRDPGRGSIIKVAAAVRIPQVSFVKVTAAARIPRVSFVKCHAPRLASPRHCFWEPLSPRLASPRPASPHLASCSSPRGCFHKNCCLGSMLRVHYIMISVVISLYDYSLI